MRKISAFVRINQSDYVAGFQATRLILHNHNPESACFEALNLHFDTPKGPSKVSLHIHLNG